jgi:subtilisin
MASQEPKLQRYIVMPKDGFDSADLKTAILMPSDKVVTVSARSATAISPKMRVLDAIRDDGPKLVEMSAEGELSLRLSMPGLKIVPVVFYYKQWYRPAAQRRPVVQAAGTGVRATASRVPTPDRGSTIKVVDRSTGAPLRGAHIAAFSDYATHTGEEGDSGGNGVIRLKAISPKQKLERVYLYGPPGYWGYYDTDTSIGSLKTIKLRPVDIKEADLLLHQLYGRLPATTGAGVIVGIIDSGVDGNHPDLRNVAGGLNCVSDEVHDDPGAKANWGPAKVEGEHGTHVAGIIAGNGRTSGFRGVAPGATLRSYRVFPNAGGGASNYDIAKAIDAATADNCAIINLSLGGGPADELTKAAIDRAIAAGVVVIAAAGNDGRKAVSFPAAWSECIAVSAMGRRRSFPPESTGTSDVAKPSGGPSSADFVADFSNIGPQIDAIGPGVEIISTLPNGNYGPMSGTSMAAPAVSGFVAHLFSSQGDVRQAHGSDRSKKLKQALHASCKPEGFGRNYEGFGLPLP